MHKNKTKRLQLAGISLLAFTIIAVIAFLLKTQVLDQRITKVDLWINSSNNAEQIMWPKKATEKALSWLESTNKDLANEITSLKVDAINTSDTNITAKLKKLLEEQKSLSEHTTLVKKLYNQDQKTLKNWPLFLSKVHNQNQSFKAELTKKYPRHQQKFEQIIEAVESMPKHIDKRVLSIKFLSRTEALVSTGIWNNTYKGCGYRLLLMAPVANSTANATIITHEWKPFRMGSSQMIITAGYLPVIASGFRQSVRLAGV